MEKVRPLHEEGTTHVPQGECIGNGCHATLEEEQTWKANQLHHKVENPRAYSI